MVDFVISLIFPLLRIHKHVYHITSFLKSFASFSLPLMTSLMVMRKSLVPEGLNPSPIDTQSGPRTYVPPCCKHSSRIGAGMS